MSAAVPTTEPSTIVAGDTVQWTKSIADYLATDGWTLSYSFRIPGSAATPITFDADPDGANYSVDQDPSTTADWPPGAYVWTSYVDDGTHRHTVGTGPVTIFASPEEALGTTHASRTLAIIEAALEGRLPRGLEMYTIDGQQVQKLTHEALSRLRDKYKAEVKSEIDAARVAAGLPSKRTMWASFRRVQ